ncbi:DUF1906 domain-containing protein [Nocardia otitidiscaviarum]|uniref:DUF1906 domain-containing protein n=1 Tax=Nocardia otitidiscaviarum TaxID=1823 RepID=UPI0004A74C23|nr:DUF1906 domain-containing protein [Nocardia otitidiscaviarum]MBF6131752.1 DUF1906 domain-containing protein [Nocardia otitidiscaviarum]MBF6482883.1 DUF1906 domain-containing protein [Nocardia otitidiscaviarum]
MRYSDVNRRDFLARAAALAGGAAALGVAGAAVAPTVTARTSLGTLLDYAGGVPDARAIAEAGHIGVIRYVSDRRPGAEWMAGKPLLAAEVAALQAVGLSIVSCYQFGKGPTADWRGGFEAGKQHAQRGLELHNAAGGPDTAPIYASIDDNPSEGEFHDLIAPYLEGWEAVLGRERTGVYANTPTIDWTRGAGLGSWFWQHNWGTPKGFVHPAAHLHQFEIDKRTVDGVGVDLNAVLTPDYGQW